MWYQNVILKMKVLDFDPQNKMYGQTLIHKNKYINKRGVGTALSYNGIPISIEQGN